MSQHPQYGIELKQDNGTDPQNKQTGKDRHLMNYGKQKSEAVSEPFQFGPNKGTIFQIKGRPLTAI